MFAPLAQNYRLGFEYSDCWADDARLVVVNAIDAQQRGARIEPGWALTSARREGSVWLVDITSKGGEQRTVATRALVNAAGPWVEEILHAAGAHRHRSLRLVKGSHIVVRRLYDGPQAYTLQNADGRVVFAIPYEDDFTLIGTEIPRLDNVEKTTGKAIYTLDIVRPGMLYAAVARPKRFGGQVKTVDSTAATNLSATANFTGSGAVSLDSGLISIQLSGAGALRGSSGGLILSGAALQSLQQQ